MGVISSEDWGLTSVALTEKHFRFPMMGLGFIASSPILLHSIPSRWSLSNRCRRYRSPSRSTAASISTLHTVCAHSELPRKRGRPKGSKNRSKPEKGHDPLMRAGKALEGADSNYAEQKSKHSEIEKQYLNLEEQPLTELNQITKKERRTVKRRAQSVQSSKEELHFDRSGLHGAENTRKSLRRPKRGRPPKEEAHDALPNELAAEVYSERLEPHGNTKIEGKSGHPMKVKGPKRVDIATTTRSFRNGEEPHELLEDSIESIELQSKRTRGGPRAIANEVEQKVVAQNMESKTGDFQSSPAKQRKRGRPRGSKNKPKATSSSGIPSDAIHDNASTAAEDEAELDLLDLFEMYNKSHTQEFHASQRDWKEAKLRAPNGLPGSGPDDFIFELLPLVAKMEAEQNRVVPEKEKNFRRYMDKVFHQFASSHRSDGRQRNLKPFRLREDEKKVCVKCEGLGTVRCDYCEGFGLVDFGENAERFYNEFGADSMPLPKHVMGTMYHCPYCDGSLLEDCDECSGTGSIEDRFPRKAGASRTPVNNYAKKGFSLEEFVEKEKDRIDVGLDGTIILKARKRRRAKDIDIHRIQARQSSSAQENQSVPQEQGSAPPGYHSQTNSPALSRLRAVLQKRGMIPYQGAPRSTKMDSLDTNSNTTAFVHTTDYKVGRSLRRRKPIQFSSKAKSAERDSKIPNEEQRKNLEPHRDGHTIEE